MGTGIVQTVHLTVHLEQGIFPPSYLHAFRAFRGKVLIRRHPDAHVVAYSPRLERGASRCWTRLFPESPPRIQSLGAQTPSGRRLLGTPGWLARSCASRRRPSTPGADLGWLAARGTSRSRGSFRRVSSGA